MSKRFIRAVFSDGKDITRTTTNDKLAWGWRARWTYANDMHIPINRRGKSYENAGFASTENLARQAANQYGFQGANVQIEVVAVMVLPEPLKPKPNVGDSVRIIRKFSNGAENFLKDGRTHRRWTSRAEAQAWIEWQLRKFPNALVTYRIV